MSRLTSKDALTLLIHRQGIYTWNELLTYTQKLPYGRNENRFDFSLVIKEQKGTCSSKHAFLKEVANQNHLEGIQLILGMYKMNASNTPKIGTSLSEQGIAFIPEAHCYLKVDGRRLDITTSDAKIDDLSADILLEQEISPNQVSNFKVDFHKNYLKKWLKEISLEMTFDELWLVRERCIQNLTR